MAKKATIAGDFLADQLRVVASFRDSPTGKVLQGIFADVEWGIVQSNDPARALGQALEAIGRAAVPAALSAITAVSLTGPIFSGYVAVGLKLARIFSKMDVLTMPWQEYSRPADEDYTNLVLDAYAGTVDWTGLFAPPWAIDAPWRLGLAGDPERPRGAVWAPWTGSEIPWSANGGAIPGTMRVFGQVQLTGTAGPVDPKTGKPAPELRRIGRAASGVSVGGTAQTGHRKDLELPWPYTVTNCGDFYPAVAQTAGVMWNAAEKAGSPDMFKIDTHRLLREWSRAIEAMEESFAELWDNFRQLQKDIGSPFVAEARRQLSQAMETWIAVRVAPGQSWRLGSPWRVPSFHAIITPGVLRGELPGDPAGRTPSLWIEEDLAHDMTRESLDGVRIGRDAPLKYPGWPYGRKPRQHHCAGYKACSSDLAATLNLETVLHPASWKNANGPAPPGYRKVPFPPPEVDAAEYSSMFRAIIKPALDRLAAQQQASLQTTLVAAYVRPVAVGDKPAYGAFAGPEGSRGAQLRALCLAMREKILTSNKRYCCNLEDVEPIDPVFAEQLRKAGVTGTWRDFSRCLDVRGPLVEGAAPPPAGEPPQGGLVFEAELVDTARGRGGGGKAAAGLAAAALAAAAFVRRS